MEGHTKFMQKRINSLQMKQREMKPIMKKAKPNTFR